MLLLSLLQSIVTD